MAKLITYRFVYGLIAETIQADGFSAGPNEVSFYINHNGDREVFYYRSLNVPFSIKKL